MTRAKRITAAKTFHDKGVVYAPGDEVPEEVANRVGRHVLDMPAKFTDDQLAAPPLGDSGLPEEEIWQERRVRFQKHLEAHPLRRCQVPDALRDVEVFKGLAAERAALVRSEERIAREHGEVVTRNEQAREEYDDAVRRATLHGEPFPEPLRLEPWHGPERAGDLLRGYHAVLEAMERSLLAERAAEWEQVLVDRAKPTRKRINLALQAVAAAEEEHAPFKAALDELRRLTTSGRGLGAAADHEVSINGEPTGFADRVIPPARRSAEVAAEEQVLAEFKESRTSRSSRPALRKGRR